MPRDVPVGNGKILVAFDKDSLLCEFHFPHVGQENHAGEPFRFGVWADGQFSWIPDGWQVKRDYLDDTLVTNIEWVHEGLGLRIWVNDLVDFTDNIYLKKLTVESQRERDIKLFFAHNFHIFGNDIGDTAAFMPENKTLVHFKGDRYFLVNVRANNKFGVDSFATGNRDTWKDAEDGFLSGNPISQGSVGSAVGVSLTVPAGGAESCYYWVAVGKNWVEVKALNEMIKKTTPEEIFKRTADYWKCWVDKEKLNYDLLPEKVARLYKRSLLICRTQINNCGSIIAANDSDAIQFNRDTYSYMWPRDGSLVAYGLNLAGYDTSDFFRFCAKILEKEGFFLHKYMPSGALGSSWHPWIENGKLQLPIQEDETALVIWALWNHYEQFRDLELIRPLYLSLIRKAADFMMNYRDLKTGLPLQSYDLWEERRGVLTFTVSAVYGGLMGASHFAKAFGDDGLAKEYREGAEKIRAAMDQYLYLPDKGRFARMIRFNKDGSVEVDATIDASLYGIFAFGAYRADEEQVKSTMDQILGALKVGGGIIRYENDPYYKQNEWGPSNPWFVTTLWIAQYQIAKAKTRAELDQALEILEWVADHALPSGVLAEQVNAETNEPISVSPLTWSHGTFITAVQEYITKLLTIEICPGCGLPKVSKRR